MTIEEAKELLHISELWTHFGFPREPKKSCRSPFRDDSNASFSVYDESRRWRDFATGEGGDAITFLCFASGLGPKEGTVKFLEMASAETCSLSARSPKRKPKKEDGERPLPTLPELRAGTDAEYRRLGKLRNLNPDVLRIANARGFLFFATVKERPAWIVTDGTRRNAQARRLDGGLWEHIDGKKAFTLPGSWAKWPLGAEESKPFPFVALVEGGPDLLAFFQYCWAESRLEDVAPVAMLGASMPIHEDALPLFAGKHIRIFPHLDGAGQEGAATWYWQLKRAGAEVDGFSFEGFRMTNGEPCRDLNDMTSIDADSFEALAHDLMP